MRSAPKAWADKPAAIASYAKQAQAGRPPNAPGVYGFWVGMECVYIGQSKNLSKRLGSHERKGEWPGCVVIWAGCQNHIDVEQWLIEGLSPCGNGRTQAARLLRDRRQADHQKLGSVDERFKEIWLCLGFSGFWQ